MIICPKCGKPVLSMGTAEYKDLDDTGKIFTVKVLSYKHSEDIVLKKVGNIKVVKADECIVQIREA